MPTTNGPSWRRASPPPYSRRRARSGRPQLGETHVTRRTPAPRRHVRANQGKFRRAARPGGGGLYQRPDQGSAERSLSSRANRDRAGFRLAIGDFEEDCRRLEWTEGEREGCDCDRLGFFSTICTQELTIAGTNSPLGIGRASAHQFAQNGAKAIYICDFNDSNLETHKRELASLYPDVEVHSRIFDASDEEAVKAVVDDAVKKYGRLDIFFANAGIVGQPKIFSEVTAEEFLHTLKTNVVR